MVYQIPVSPTQTPPSGIQLTSNSTAITSPDIGSGGYFNRLQPARANAQAYDEEARSKLRRLSEELTGAH